MEQPPSRSFPPIEAGALLAGITMLCVALGALIGWAAGATKIGLIVGAVIGIPAGVSGVYIRYHEYFA